MGGDLRFALTRIKGEKKFLISFLQKDLLQLRTATASSTEPTFLVEEEAVPSRLPGNFTGQEEEETWTNKFFAKQGVGQIAAGVLTVIVLLIFGFWGFMCLQTYLKMVRVSIIYEVRLATVLF